MNPKTKYSVVLATAPDAKTAEKLARGAVEHRFAACVNVIPGVTSHYFWKGKLHKESELMLVMKTRTGVMPQLIAYVRENHGGEVPEVLGLPIVEGDKTYLDWVGANTLFSKFPEEERAPL